METMGKIFGSQARVKMMRLFLLNPGRIYDLKTVSELTKTEPREARRELDVLSDIKMIRTQTFTNEAVLTEPDALKKGKRTKFSLKKKKTQGWALDERFTYLSQLQSLLINTILIKEDEITRRISQLGKVKLIVIAGVFLQQWDSRADILVVGERLKESQLQGIIRKIEGDIGKELSYALLETPDFQYRMSVCDKLVRDIFDYPHRVILDKMGIKLGF